MGNVTWRTPPTEGEKRAAQADAVRAERDRRLRDTDWVVSRATELDEPVPYEWSAYRRALRGVSGQPGFPGDVLWPSRPDNKD